MQLANLKDLDTQGFVVLKNILDKSEIDNLISDYNANKSKKIAMNLGNSYIPANVDSIKLKIEKVITQISLNTTIHVDLITPASMAIYFDNNLISWPMHQDHGPYFKFQQAYNSLNIWIPMIMPDPLSGLGVLPFESLYKTYPKLTKDHIFNKGAQIYRYSSDGNKTEIINHNDDAIIPIDGNIFDLMVIPQIDVGDILIMRADIPHTSLASSSHRVAVSLRCFNSNALISKDKFFAGGNLKKNYVRQSVKEFEKIFKMFEQEPNKEIFTIAELKSII